MTDHRWMAAELEPISRSRAGWQRIYLDLPGRGQTPAQPWIVHQDQVLDIFCPPGPTLEISVPAFFCSCQVCEAARNNPEHRRTRASVALLGQEVTLIDASPDLGFQLERERIQMSDSNATGVDHSALVILVPEADPLVAAYRERYDPSAAQGMPAHITLLYPFLPPAAIGDDVLTELQALFAAFPAFPYTLSAVRTFPDRYDCMISRRSTDAPEEDMCMVGRSYSGRRARLIRK